MADFILSKDITIGKGQKVTYGAPPQREAMTHAYVVQEDPKTGMRYEIAFPYDLAKQQSVIEE